jgi:N-acyl-D-amino-acid deacylase
MRQALIILAALLTTGGAPPPADHFAVILRHGTIVDGSGLLPYRADVAIAEGRIARIGNLSRATARLELDVRGLYVAPGFINIHSHPSPAALATAENMLTQGVTTEIMNADGSGAIDLKDQMLRLAAGGLAVNVGGYIGFNRIWTDVVGPSDRRPTAEEIERMRDMITAGMEVGAWGVSAGLDYKPAYFARTDEVIAVVSAAGPFRTNFNNHERVTPESGFSSSNGIAETLKIADEANLVPVVTHMKSTGRERGAAAQALALFDAPERQGRYAAADVYPYLAGMTGLGALILPPWAQDGGRDALLARLAEGSTKERIVRNAEETLIDRFGSAEAIYLPTLKKPLTAFMEEWRASAGEAIVRLVATSNPVAIIEFGIESDLEAILRHPAASIACDCGATTATATHPRNYGSYPRVLGRYVRERQVLTWQEAIRKMTGLPAATIGMTDRGYLAPGMVADVTVFDPRTVIDHATYENPAALSEGVRHVFVNGELALRDGKVTGARGGRALARGAGMPSRPMKPDAAAQLTIKGRHGRAQFDVDIRQDAGRREARGKLKISVPDNEASLTVTRFGVLQVADRWASLTAQAMMKPEGIERPVTITIDAGDPRVPVGEAVVLIEVEGVRAYRLPLPATAIRQR